MRTGRGGVLPRTRDPRVEVLVLAQGASADGTGRGGARVRRAAARATRVGRGVEAGRWLVRVEPGFDAATLLRALEALAAT